MCRTCLEAVIKKGENAIPHNGCYLKKSTEMYKRSREVLFNEGWSDSGVSAKMDGTACSHERDEQ